MRRIAFAAIILTFALSPPAYAGTALQIVPTTTLSAETGNNTSTSKLFVATANGDLGPTNVSKVDTHRLLYPGFTGKIYAHLMGWFCMQSGSTATGAGTLCGKHVQVGYNSNDPSVVQAQVNDMISRGFDGVIHDWYGPGKPNDDMETKNYMNEAERHPNFTFALMIDKGAIEWYSCYPGCTATEALLQITQYAAATFFNSPAYMRINNRPMLTNFDLDLHYTIDWNYVAANTPGNPIFIFQNGSGFTHVLSGGSYTWVKTSSGLDSLASFYDTSMQYPALYTVGGMYKGFNDTLASWSGNRIMSQQCGQTWLQTFAVANNKFNSSNQLDAIQLITWDDYEEGTEIETGIDNCFSLSGAMSGTTLTWSISGDETTIDHYTVFISADGQNLMSLGDFPVGTRQLNLSTYSPAAGTTYTLYVKAVGKPSLRNQMSGAVTFANTPGVHMTSPASGATLGSPVNVSAYAVSSYPISSMKVYVDYNEVYHIYSSSVNTTVAMGSGQHLVVINAWDSSGALMQAKATITVTTQLPTASLSLSSTTAVAPATITASTSGSTDPNSGGTISSSLISWGDASSSAGPTASHTYKTAGTYTVTATVTDNYGLSSSTTQALTIKAPSIAITSPSTGATLASPVHVKANAVSGLPISAIIVYLDYNEVYRTNSASVDTSLTMAAGPHLLVTNAWDSAGTLMQAQANITVASGPTAALSLSSTSGVAPVNVTGSTSSSTDSNATISSSTINWGDGTSSPGPSATHIYSNAGSYSVTATVNDSLGLSNTSGAQTVTVQPATVVITKPVNGTIVSSPFQVTATATSGRTISSMTVYLDGNSVFTVSAASVNTSVTAVPGIHTIIVKATDSAGTTMQSAPVGVSVPSQQIVAALSVTASVTSPLTMTASTAGSTDPNIGATLTSVINWGDSASSTGPTATHTYASPGVYTVTATVSDSYGLSASASRTVTAAGVVIHTPANGVTVDSPIRVWATAFDSNRIASMTVYVDNSKKYTVYSNSLDTKIKVRSGTHRIVVNAWEDVTGVLFQSSVTVTVP